MSYMDRGGCGAKQSARAKKRNKGADEMDFAGFNWTLLTIVGPLILAVVILWAALPAGASALLLSVTMRSPTLPCIAFLLHDNDAPDRGA